jgi:integral membrane protein
LRAGRAKLGDVEIEQPKVGETLAHLSPLAQLRRKVRVTKIIAIAEAVSYSLLAVFMFRKYVLDNRSDSNYLFLRVVAYFHGFICIAFAVMVADIFRAMTWTRGFALATLLGPPGALLAHHRLRTQHFPDSVRREDMLF